LTPAKGKTFGIIVFLYGQIKRDMEEILQFDTVSEYDRFHHQENFHPLVSVIDFRDTPPLDYAPWMRFGFYAVFLKDVKCGDMKYGRKTYDYQDRTLVFVAPGQVISMEITRGYKPQGYGLLFHPDLIAGTALAKHLSDYTFFDYEAREALHISERERKLVLDCFSKITYELEQSIDKHSKMLISANIELFLNYCTRFYDRQFLTRDQTNKGIIKAFDILLDEYFKTDEPIGLPTVGYFAEHLSLSANYFGDLIKKETGKTAQEYIQLNIMNIAKDRILGTTKSFSEIAYSLGFKYPQHFTRAFKKITGFTPNDYRVLN
jgi:AraC family transcriptional activator of pobA